MATSWLTKLAPVLVMTGPTSSTTFIVTVAEAESPESSNTFTVRLWVVEDFAASDALTLIVPTPLDVLIANKSSSFPAEML